MAKREQLVWSRKSEARRTPQKTQLLGHWVDRFMRREVYPKQKRLGQLGRAWMELLPEELVDHTCLENLRGGCLRVLVDNASSLYELALLKESLIDQLYQLCPGVAPSDIRFVRGLWYQTNEEGFRIPNYRE